MQRTVSDHRRTVFGTVAIAASLMAGIAWYSHAAGLADDSNTNQTLSAFMRKKLDASSKVLEGLTTEDAQLLQQGAQSLLEMSKAERWKVLFNSDFRSHDVEFRDTVRKLLEAAEKGNFDNAALQWFDVTKSCIECHRDVRNAGKTK